MISSIKKVTNAEINHSYPASIFTCTYFILIHISLQQPTTFFCAQRTAKKKFFLIKSISLLYLRTLDGLKTKNWNIFTNELLKINITEFFRHLFLQVVHNINIDEVHCVTCDVYRMHLSILP